VAGAAQATSQTKKKTKNVSSKKTKPKPASTTKAVARRSGRVDWEPNEDDLVRFPPDFWVPPHRIEPPHGVRRPKHFESLVRSFQRHGWRGRPVLVETIGRDGWLGWTSSHRLPAAIQAGVKLVPIVVLDKAAYVRVHGRPKRSFLSETSEDEERLGRLIECGDERAARLMARECGLTPLDAEHLLRRPRRTTGGPPRVAGTE
jgi:hypothetical protein